VIVTDANVIAYFAVRDERSALVDALFEMDAAWAAPLLWRSEFCNALAKYMQYGGMSLDAALAALHLAADTIGECEHKVSPEKVLELAAQSQCTAYDCEYVALALDLNVPLVTTDKQLLRAFPKIAVSLEQFVKKK
jgi:predicted nucleic acid-binding protein